MAKQKRAIRYESDPTEEKIEQVIQKFDRAVPARFTALWGNTRAEVVSAVPIASPVGYVKQPSLSERIRAMVRSEHLRAAAEGAGYETFDEAEDFDVDDDPELRSNYEIHETWESAPTPRPNEPPPGPVEPQEAPKPKGRPSKPTQSAGSPLATPQSGGEGSEGS